MSSDQRDFKADPECGQFIAWGYEKAGLRLVPVPRSGKNPRVPGFGAENPHFTTLAIDFREDDVPAILCGPLKDGRELCCLDVDGSIDQAAIAAALGELPPTLSSKGGRHLWYFVPDCPEREAIKQWVRLVKWEGGGLDLKWRGGYAIERGDWDSPFSLDSVAELSLENVKRIVETGSRIKESKKIAPGDSASVVAALAKVWPRSVEDGGTGGRYEAALALGGILARSDWELEEISEFASNLFAAAECDDRQEQVLGSVDTVRSGGTAYGWPKLREHMVGSKAAIGRACGAFGRLLGLDKQTREGPAGAPRPGDFIVADPENPVDRHIRISQLEEILARREAIYQRGGTLVKALVTDRTPGSGEPLGTTRANLAIVREELSRGAEKFWVKKTGDRGNTWIQVDPPVDESIGLIDSGSWPNIRALKGIAACPFLRPDGTVCEASGYDADTGWLLEGRLQLPEPIPPTPSLELAQQALRALLTPWCDFPWETPAAALLPVSLVLSGLARAAVEDVPAHCLDASTPGTGKTLALDLACCVLRGCVISKSTFPSEDEELEKVLGSYALAGAPIVSFDNIYPGRRFGGEALDKVLSGRGRARLRILGKSESPELPWTTLVCATGNNLQLTTDMTRRALVSRLIAPIERPEERTGFSIPDVVRWTIANRAALVWAGLVILRAHQAAGAPKCGLELGSFESWSRVVADALMWVSGADVRTLKRGSEADPHSDTLAGLWLGLEALTRDGGWVSAKDILAAAFERSDVEMLALRESLSELIITKQAARPNPKQLGRLLAAHRDQIKEGLRLVAQTRQKALMWKLMPVEPT